LTRYTGGPRLIRATATSRSTRWLTASRVTEHPDPGEVVWCDDAGVTCRRWNWRQARRTQLLEDTSTALFILDALEPVTGEAPHAAADDLLAQLAWFGTDVRAVRRLIAAGTTPDEGD
jgi:DNA/RNA-binding domain of Phe-tRNA-synthetase-like protein